MPVVLEWRPGTTWNKESCELKREQGKNRPEILTKEYPIDVISQATTQHCRVAKERQVDTRRENALVHHGHGVVFESQDAVVDVQLGQFFLVDAHLVLRLHVHDTLLHFVPGQVVQFALMGKGCYY